MYIYVVYYERQCVSFLIEVVDVMVKDLEIYQQSLPVCLSLYLSLPDGDTMVLPLWQTVLIGVCGAIALVVLTVLFCLLLCCGCKASKRWGRREYHTGPSETHLLSSLFLF